MGNNRDGDFYLSSVGQNHLPIDCYPSSVDTMGNNLDGDVSFNKSLKSLTFYYTFRHK